MTGLQPATVIAAAQPKTTASGRTARVGTPKRSA
jgi:hypothetical protein